MPEFEVEQDDWKPIPTQTYVPARLEKIEQSRVEFTDKKTGELKSFEKLEWTFRVTAGEYADRTVRGTTDAKVTTHPANQFRAWVEAILDDELYPGFRFNTDMLVGLPCAISVRHEQDRRNEKRIWERVSDVVPASQADIAGDEVPF